MRVIKLLCIAFTVIIFGFGYNSYAIDYVNTDYMHEFKQDINNIVDNNEDTFFVLEDFTNYLEFKLVDGAHIKNIEFVFDSVLNNYEYKIYSSENGYEYYEVKFNKKIKDNFTESIKLNIKDEFVKVRIFSSYSDDFIHIKEIRFLDNKGNIIDLVEPIKENPEINTQNFVRQNKSEKDIIGGLISRTMGDKYINFFEFEYIPNDRGYDYFQIESLGDKIILRGNNINSIAVALNYYYEYYLNQTYSRFGEDKIKVVLPLPKIEDVIEKKIDMNLRYNYNHVAYGYTMAYWDFEQWEREIDWMALNGFNMALHLTGHEEVIRRFLDYYGFSFQEIVSYLTSPIYLSWQFMGNITRIGGEMTPKWFEDRSKLSNNIQNRMLDFMIQPVHQAYIGYFPHKEGSEISVLPGGYWSYIQSPSRVRFDNGDYERTSEVFYNIQKEVMGESRYFSGDLFHEGGNPFGYDETEISEMVLQSLKNNNSEDAIWVIQSWSTSPKSETIDSLDRKNTLIIDLHSNLNTRWKGTADFNGMGWSEKEFNNSNWIFSSINNFGGRSGMYGHTEYLLDQFYDAKNNAEFLVGVGQTPEAIGDNEFVDELTTELIFEDDVDLDEFKLRYIKNRYGEVRSELVKAWDILIDTVYNPTTEIYHEGASESIINARPDMGLKSSSKWGVIHKNYNSDILEKALNYFFAVYDDFKNNKEYIRDLIDISSEVLVNLANDYYESIEEAYEKNDMEEFKSLSEKFLYIINLQANVLAYDEDNSLKKVFKDIEDMEYDDYFEDTLQYNKSTLLTVWHDKLASEESGLRNYSNTDYYELVGNLYYSRWDRYFDRILSGNVSEKEVYDDYRYDLQWVYDENSLEFNRSKKSLKELVELVIVESSMKKTRFSFLANLIYSIRSLF